MTLFLLIYLQIHPTSTPNLSTIPPHLHHLTRQALGTPYQWGGPAWKPGSNLGVDCSSLGQGFILAATGKTIPRTTRKMLKDAIPFPGFHNLQPLDVILFQMKEGRHCVIWLGGAKSLALHAPSPGKTVCLISLQKGSPQQRYWQPKIIGIYRP